MAAAAQTRSRKSQGVRVDPKRRHVQAISPWLNLKNRDPDKHYVLAGAPGTDFGPEYYAAMPCGYEVVVKRPGGEHFAAGVTCKDGEPITYRGQHVLMACPMDAYLEQEEHGDGLGVGQAGYDLIMNQIRKSKPKKDIVDSELRPGDHVSVGQSAEFTQEDHV